jgi:hypothetical protein
VTVKWSVTDCETLPEEPLAGIVTVPVTDFGVVFPPLPPPQAVRMFHSCDALLPAAPLRVTLEFWVVEELLSRTCGVAPLALLRLAI